MLKFRLRWWMWIFLAVLLLAGAATSVHISGRLRLEAVLAEVRARGLPVTPSELVASAPAVDSDRQRRLGRFVFGNLSWGDRVPTMPFMNLAEQRVSQQDCEQLAVMLRAGTAMTTEVGAILDEGPVMLSLLGYCERDPAKLRRLSLAEAAAQAIPSLLNTRALANWWATQACQAADPEPHLHRLDQWVSALGRPGSLIDAMIAIAIGRTRDDVHLWLAVRGRLPAARLAIWLDEAPEHCRWLADGYAAERAWFWDLLARSASLLAPAFGMGDDSLPERLLLGLRIWPLHGYDCASGLAALTNCELRLRRLPPMPEFPMPWNLPRPLTDVAMPHLEESIVTACEAENGHRLSRLAAIIAVHHRRHGILPVLADLPADLLAGRGPDLPPLRYETFPPHRFRIGIDPAGPLPPSVPAGRWSDRFYASAIGTPPSTNAVGTPRRWSLELDLDAILIPPPERPTKPGKP
jgi:hypothetical protein